MNNETNLLSCCPRCQYYGSCITKWLRGEKGEPDYCCDHCPFFFECNPQSQRKQNLQNNIRPNNKTQV